MNRGHFLDVSVPHGNEQSGEVPVSVSQDALDVPMPLRKEQLVEVPTFVFQGRIQQRTFEQFADNPEVEELVFKVVSQDRVQQRVVEQNIEVPVDKFISQISVKSVEVVKTVFLMRVSERSCEHGGGIRSFQDLEPRPNVTRCSRAADDRTVGGCAHDRVSRQTPPTDCRADR